MTDVKPQRFCSCLEVPPRRADEVTRTKGRAALLVGTHWGAKRRLSVGFIGGSPAVRQRVANIATAWTRTRADLSFDFWMGLDIDPTSADIRVSFVQNGRSWSVLGTTARQVPRDEPTMNLGWLTEVLPEDQARSVILHEFGHALGLIHEHQNPHRPIQWDVDAVVRDLSGPPNNWDAATIQTNMFAQYSDADLLATDTDPASIMMYAIPQRWTLDDFEVGFNSTLSADDIRLIETAYPKIGI